MFRCTGACSFETCPVKFKVEVYSFSDTDPNIKLEIYMLSNFVKHKKGDKKSRFIRGSKRLKVAEELEFQSPSTLYSKQYCKLSQNELESGKRDIVGSSPEVIRKISSEAKQRKLPHPNLITSLHLLSEEMTDITTNQPIPCYIQRITAFPFSLILYTEQGVRLYHHLARDSTVFCDATGTVVSLKGAPEFGDKKVLYYSLVLSNSKPKQPPVAVAEFISTEHSVLAISHFIECFRRSEGLLYGYKNIIIPKHVVIDRSLVLL